MQKWWPAALIAVALGASAAAGASQLAGSSDTPTPAVETGSKPIAAHPRPATAPEPVAGTGACGEQMTALRSLMDAVTTGALLDDGQSRLLTDGLTRLDAACSKATAEEFRARELLPWLTYTPS